MGQLSAERTGLVSSVREGLQEATEAGDGGSRNREAQARDRSQASADSLPPSGSPSAVVIRERKRSLPCFSSVRPDVVFPQPPSDANSPPSVLRHTVSTREGRPSYRHEVSLPEIPADNTPVANGKEGRTNLSRLQKLRPPELTLESTTHRRTSVSTAATEPRKSATVTQTPPRSTPLTPKPPPSGSPTVSVGRRGVALPCRKKESAVPEVVSNCLSPPLELQQETGEMLPVPSEALTPAPPDSLVLEALSTEREAALNGVRDQATKSTAVQSASKLDVRQELVATCYDKPSATDSIQSTCTSTRKLPSSHHPKNTPPVDTHSLSAHTQGQEDIAKCSTKDMSLHNSSLSSTDVETASQHPQQGSPVCLSPAPLMLSMVRKDLRQLRAYDSASDDSRTDTPSSCSSLRPMSKLSMQ